MVCFVDNDPVYWGVAANFLRRNRVETGRCVDHDTSAIDKMVKDYEPAIIIVCFKSTKPDTINSVKWINEKYPEIKIIISTQYSSVATLKRCEVVKYIGCFFKSSHDISRLLELINDANEKNRII
jgi:DNA-binding NarL/FixJ family response regulator